MKQAALFLRFQTERISGVARIEQLSLERCFDYRRIKKFPEFTVLISSEIFYLMETEGGKDLGVWSLHPWKDGVLIHASMGDGCRGRKAVDSSQSAFQWIFENTEFNKIYATISNKKRQAQFVASWSGMDYIYSIDNFRVYRIEA